VTEKTSPSSAPIRRRTAIKCGACFRWYSAGMLWPTGVGVGVSRNPSLHQLVIRADKHDETTWEPPVKEGGAPGADPRAGSTVEHRRRSADQKAKAKGTESRVVEFLVLSITLGVW